MGNISVVDIDQEIDNYYDDNEVYLEIRLFKGDGEEVGTETIIDRDSPWNALAKIRQCTTIDKSVAEQIQADEDEANGWISYKLPGFKSNPIDGFPSIRKESGNG